MAEEVFLLAYGGLRWSPQEVEDLPRLERRWYVKRITSQHEQERDHANGK